MSPSVGKVVAVAPDLDVLIEAERWTQLLPRAEQVCQAAFNACLQSTANHRTGDSPPQACLLLADDARVRDLNLTFRGRDEPTNILSFPAVEADVLAAVGAEAPPPYLGDLIIALETTAGEAAAEAKTLSDHLSHLVVHGTLHLLGYDHQTEADAAIMESLETRILARLGVANPYAVTGESD